MKRRNSIKNTFSVAGVSEVPSTDKLNQSNFLARQNNFKTKYAPHFGMFKRSAGDDLIGQLKFMADTGFTVLEDNGMMSRTPEIQSEIGDTMAKFGMEMGLFVLDKGGDGATLAAGKKEYIDIFLNGCKRAVEVAKRCNAKFVKVVPGKLERNLHIAVQNGSVIDALILGAEIFEPHGIVMLLEPQYDRPSMFLTTFNQTFQICASVNSPSCKMLFDIYHMRRNERLGIMLIDFAWNEIGYFQIGDYPRGIESTTGGVNYKNIFENIYKKSKAENKSFIFGMEHIHPPVFGGEQALIKSCLEADSFEI